MNNFFSQLRQPQKERSAEAPQPALTLASLARQVRSLALATDAQMQECLNEVGISADVEALFAALERKAYLTPFQIEKLRRGEETGYHLGESRLLYKIASGSFGRVFRADKPQTGEVVAVKVLRSRWAEDADNVALFQREARLSMKLQHPNIVRVIEVGYDAQSNQHFIIMEFVEGGSLRDFLAIRKKLAPAEALRLLEDVAGALAYSHALGLAHRDIKLTNILISSQGVAKLADFGLGQMFAPDDGNGNEVRVHRTVDYAGLEKATGVTAGDLRSDIYFLGCVFYEMLTGRPPLDETRDQNARMDKRRFENVALLRPEEIDGPASIVPLVETMMSLVPEQRYQTVAQLLQALRQVRSELPGTASSRKEGPTICLVEGDHKLQEVIGTHLRKDGYRVLAAQPAQAVERFVHEGFEGLIVDAGSTHEDGVRTFRRILAEARHKRVPCHGLLLLSEHQRPWDAAIKADQEIARAAVVMIRPVKMSELTAKVHDLLPRGTTEPVRAE